MQMVDNKNTSEKGRLGAIAKHKKYSQEESLNPNWRGGRSKDNYYYKKRQKERFPEKVKAREKVYKALRSGKLVKPDECEKCGRNMFLHGHHIDYNQPLKVVWYCKTCHAGVHR